MTNATSTNRGYGLPGFLTPEYTVTRLSQRLIKDFADDIRHLGEEWYYIRRDGGSDVTFVSSDLVAELMKTGHQIQGGKVKLATAPKMSEVIKLLSSYIERVSQNFSIPLDNRDSLIGSMKALCPRYAKSSPEAAIALGIAPLEKLV